MPKTVCYTVSANGKTMLIITPEIIYNSPKKLKCNFKFKYNFSIPTWYFIKYYMEKDKKTENLMANKITNVRITSSFFKRVGNFHCWSLQRND